MIERMIEERARGNPQAAEEIRRDIINVVGDDLQSLKPGSECNGYDVRRHPGERSGFILWTDPVH